ncbi:MAG: hypothetical protein WBV22_06390 [Anaerolineaceae bacterium]
MESDPGLVLDNYSGCRCCPHQTGKWKFLVLRQRKYTDHAISYTPVGGMPEPEEDDP